MRDIIAAVATPRGKGGIAVIRISGEGAGKLLPALFRPCPEKVKPRYMYYGEFLLQDKAIDSGLAVLFEQGRSFTGEETVELHCHGGARVASLLLEAVVACGARPAQPGEFTRRAFLNGQLDLSEAEAVGDMIEAQSAAAVLLAKQSLSGGVKEKIEAFRGSLTDMLASIEADIDYPEEIEEQQTRKDTKGTITDMLKQVNVLINTYERGRVRKEGISVCLLGRPNAGKSSLLNRLCGRDSAIVTPIAGTTRDVLHETVEMDGIAVHLYDTAGLREGGGEIESIGIERARRQAGEADLVLYLADSSEGITDNDRAALSELDEHNKPYIVLFSKSDLAPRENVPESAISISVHTGDGLDRVKNGILACAGADEGIAIASLRHRYALQQCASALSDALAAADIMPLDCVYIDLHRAWESLGEITGESVNQEIIDRIFSKFCLGK